MAPQQQNVALQMVGMENCEGNKKKLQKTQFLMSTEKKTDFHVWIRFQDRQTTLQLHFPHITNQFVTTKTAKKKMKRNLDSQRYT